MDTLTALRTHKYLDVGQLRDRDVLPAVRTLQRSNRIALFLFAFRVYRRHAAIVARASDAVAALAVHVLPVARLSFRQPLESGRDAFLPGLVPLCFGNPLNVFAPVAHAEAFEILGGYLVVS